MNTPSDTIAKNASVVSFATLISRVLGLLRDMVFAFVLGTGPLADAFIVAFRLPNLLRRLFAEGSLTIAFIPTFTRTKNDQGNEQAFALTRAVQIWLLIILGGIVLTAIIFGHPLTQLIAPGFQDKNPEIFELTVYLVRLCFPYILLISAVALCMGILNSMDVFFTPSLAPAILNVSMICFGLFGYYFKFNVALCMAFGVLAGGIAQWLSQQRALTKLSFQWKGSYRLFDPGVLHIGKLMLPTVFSAAVYQINILVVSTILASQLPFGSISSLFLADRLVQFPLGVFGIAISTAALPSLSLLASKKAFDEFKATLNSSVRLTLFIVLPSTAGLLALGHPIIAALFERGEFTTLSTQATTAALYAYALGLPAVSLIRTLLSAFYALDDTKTPVLIATLCVVVNILLAVVLMKPWGHVGLALAVSITAWLQIVLLGFFLHRKKGSWYSWPDIWKTLILCLGLYLGALSTNGHTILSLLLIPLWAGAYFTIGHLLKIDEAETTWKLSKKLITKISKTNPSHDG